jgi:hypothetical protein
MFIVTKLTFLYSEVADSKNIVWLQYLVSSVFIPVHRNKHFRKQVIM